MRTNIPFLLSCLALTTAVLCAGVEPVNATEVADSIVLDSGQATWYGPRHEGRLTSSGEVFNSHKLTAAHASLPLGSYVRVTVTSSGRSIVVKVNDREPPHGIRCIDLSREAASRLGIINRGVADVRIESASKEDAAEELAEAPDDAVAVEGVRHSAHAHQASAHRHHKHR